jgi:hypothetical protein
VATSEWGVASGVVHIQARSAGCAGPVNELVSGRSVRLTHVWGSTGVHVDMRVVARAGGMRSVG